MNNLLPRDIEGFLEDLTTFQAGVPCAFEAFARAAAGLLYDKYFVIQDASLEVLGYPAEPRHESPGSFDSELLDAAPFVGRPI
jgi:hypothetical protein